MLSPLKNATFRRLFAAQAVALARALKGLAELIPVTVVNPRLTPQGWQFGGYPGADTDPLFGATYMHELYTRADPRFTGRATVPVLWDTQQNVMVSNESADILRMFDTAFEHLVASELRLYPDDLADRIDELNPRIYDALNNGVYKAGFAGTQEAYEEAVEGVFAMLDELETRLTGDFIFGDRLTETDIRTFVTLIRFDAAYHGIFKVNRRRIADYPRLTAYLRRILDLPGVRGTVDLDHIKAGGRPRRRLVPADAGDARGKRIATPDLWREERCSPSKATSSTRPLARRDGADRAEALGGVGADEAVDPRSSSSVKPK
jgi:glutathionyl-hydroquinone reductase